jgi:O-antigen ligase
MSELMLFALPVAVLLGTILGFAALAGVLHFTSRREENWQHWVIYAVLLSVAAINLSSGRDLSRGVDAGYAAQVAGLSGPGEWVTRLVSLVVLMISAERLVSTGLKASAGVKFSAPPRFLLSSFILFWFGTSLLPMFMSAHPAAFSKEYLYTLLIGVAFILSSQQGAERATIAARNGIFILNIAGLITALVNPGLVLDPVYDQGLIPGMSRFTGLSQHAVIYGLAVQFGMLCLWAKPYQKRWVNVVAWATLLVSLFWAQSKTAWSSSLVCILIVMFTQYRATLSRALLDPSRPAMSVGLLAVGLAGLCSLVLVFLFSDLGGAAKNFLASEEGANITSLTGRDKIWTIALDEWAKYPVFGYGLSLFDTDFRSLIRMSAATHSHNQFIDVLAKTGLVGALTLVFYWGVLFYWSVRYAKASGGLSLLLCTVLYLRSISEIPFLMSGYGIDFLVHILLLALVSGAHQKEKQCLAQEKMLRSRTEMTFSHEARGGF